MCRWRTEYLFEPFIFVCSSFLKCSGQIGLNKPPPEDDKADKRKLIEQMGLRDVTQVPLSIIIQLLCNTNINFISLFHIFDVKYKNKYSQFTPRNSLTAYTHTKSQSFYLVFFFLSIFDKRMILVILLCTLANTVCTCRKCAQETHTPQKNIILFFVARALVYLSFPTLAKSDNVA